MKLPKPDEQFGKYRMEDGSIIYPSKNIVDGVVKFMGEWLLWIKDGEREFEGHQVPYGHFHMEFFKTPYEAKSKLEEIRA